MTPLEKTDPEVFNIIVREKERQQHRLELIASENFTSTAVMEAQGSILPTNTPKAILVNDIMGGACTSM